MAKRSQLGDLEELVLLAVLRLGEHAYGAALREELKQRADRTASISTIYVTLMRLEEKGYARSWMGEPTGERGGKAKRYFEVLPEGVEILESVRAVRERMWEGLGTEVEARFGGPADAFDPYVPTGSGTALAMPGPAILIPGAGYTCYSKT